MIMVMRMITCYHVSKVLFALSQVEGMQKTKIKKKYQDKIFNQNNIYLL